MTRSKPRGYHHGDLREALVTAGRKLVEEKGIRGFTLRECARRAEVSHAAPAHHFASMDDLLAELVRRGFAELAVAMTTEAERVSDDEPASRLVGLGVGYMAFAAANPTLFQLMFSREANHIEPREGDEGPENVRRLLEGVLDEVIADGADDIRQQAADLAWSTMHGFITLVLDGEIGRRDSSRALKARGLAALAVMAETVTRLGRP
jgi:AcrR family transcriptional regulator